MASLELAALSQALLQQVPDTLRRLQQHVRELEFRVGELEAELEAERVSPYTFPHAPGVPGVFMTWRELAEDRMEHHETRNRQDERVCDLLENARAQARVDIREHGDPIPRRCLEQAHNSICDALRALDGETDSEEEEEGEGGAGSHEA